MRLTLRTMLAYMDDILEPQDAEEIGSKIEESEFATKLLHRTRDVMRRLRIGAPPVSEKAGKGFDPNTVAEYLDNTLPADRVPDFEKVCLESDTHLAEVASCHQILTLVLGEPAEVDADTRQKMYRLPEIAAAAVGAEQHRPEDAGVTKVDGREPPAARPDEKPEIPEYLRAEVSKRNAIWSVAAALVLLLLAGYLLLVVTGNGGGVSRLLGFGSDEMVVEAPSEPPEQIPPTPSDDELDGAAPPTIEGPVAPATRSDPPPGETEAEPAEESREPAAPGVAGELGSGDVGEAAELAPAEEPLEALPVEPGRSSVDGELAAGASETKTGGEAVVDGASELSDEPRMASLPRGTEPVDIGPAAPPLLPAGPAEESALPVPETVGEVSSSREVVLLFDPTSSTWQRLFGGTAILSDSVLLSLPTYRPLIRLGEAAGVRLVGNTRVRALPADPDGTPGVQVEYGRLVIQAEDVAGTRLRLRVGDRSGVIGLGDGASTVARE